MALGAGRASVLAMVLGQGLVLVALGLAVGIAASLALVRVLQTYLYDTAPTDPLTFVLVDHRLAGRRGARGTRSRLARDAGRSDDGASSRLENQCRRGSRA